MHIQYQIQEKGRISQLQLSFLIITLVIATADVFLPGFVAMEAKQDSWIAVIAGTISSIIIVNIFLILGLKYPEKTLVQYSCDILGKPVGKFIGFLYINYFLMEAWTVTRQLGEIFVTSFNPDAPVVVYNIIAVLVAAYAVEKGLEATARINEILLPAGLAVLMFIAIINIPNMDFKNFLPVFYNGLYPGIKGGILIQASLLESLVILQLIPFVIKKNKIRRSITISIIVLGISMGIGVLTIAVFGPLTETLLFPALEYVRMASLGPYLQNLDIVIMVVWIAGIFVKIVVFYYAGVLGISQLFNFKSYRQMVAPAGTIIICFSVVSAKMLINLIHTIHFIFPFYTFVLAFIIPCLLLTVSSVRNKTTAPKTK